MSTFTILTSTIKDDHRRVTLEDHTGTRAVVKTHPFAAVGKGEQLIIAPEHPASMRVLSADESNVEIPVTPIYREILTINIAGDKRQLSIGEIETPEEMKDYAFLENFHYKTSAGLLEPDEKRQSKKLTGGRKSVLIAYLNVGKRWIPAGYIELQMPLMMVKPRHGLFAAPYHHPSRNIAWEVWDQHSVRQYVNLIVRIARVVVSPEFRGLGIAKRLIQQSLTFAAARWHIGGRRPIFAEIVAEMLRYMDFATPAGFTYIGETEGNLGRIHKDLIAMSRGYAVSSGIMSLQKRYLEDLRERAKEHGRDFEDVLVNLEQVVANPYQIRSLPTADWQMFRPVLRFPMPYFLIGLDDYSQAYIQKNALKRTPERVRKPGTKPISGRIKIKGLSVRATVPIRHTEAVRAILDCFGLSGDSLDIHIAGPIDIEATSGNIVFIAGSSGSGKTAILKAIDKASLDANLELTYIENESANLEVEWMEDIKDKDPLIECLVSRYGIEGSIEALNTVGLAEAFVYIKPYSLLSKGQQHRAKLAKLLLGTANVWLIDEFCADLDPFSAKIAARNLRKHIVESGRIGIVAAANNIHYIDALRPTRVIVLRHGGRAEQMTYREYRDEFRDQVG